MLTVTLNRPLIDETFNAMSNDDKSNNGQDPISDTDLHKQQLEADKDFIKMADLFINQANKLCEKTDHRLVHASLLYASARFSAFITASMAENRENYKQGMDKAIEFYMEEYEKMLKEHMKQYDVVFDKRPKYPY